MVGELHIAIEKLFEKHKKGNEIPSETLRRVLMSGELTEKEFLRCRNVGGKSFNLVLALCGLRRSDSVITDNR